MNLKSWLKNNFKVSRETLLASDVARRYPHATDQPTDLVLIDRTICELGELELLTGPVKHPSTPTRLVEQTC